MTLLSSAFPSTTRQLFHNSVSSFNMDASIPISSEETVIYTMEYKFSLENFPYEMTQLPSQPLSAGYRTLAQFIYGASSLYQNPLWSSTAAPSSGSFVSGPSSSIPIVLTAVTATPT